MRQLNEKPFEEFPILRTPRLTLREIRPSDAPEILKMRANSRINQFIYRPNMEEMEQSEQLIQSVQEAYQNRKALAWAGILRDGDKIIGSLGLTNIEFRNLRAEIGGELAIEYWGKKIPLEAVKAVIDYGFQTLGLHTIEAKVSPDNRGSVFILERMGFKKEAHYRDRGYFNGEFTDMAVYTLFEEDWKID